MAPSPSEVVYSIRCLSAPMRLSATGELCATLHLTQDITLSIGRSKKSCDLTFDDARVSRLHCQLRLLSHTNTLLLLDGSLNDAELSCFAERLGAAEEANSAFLGCGSHSKPAASLRDDPGSIQNVRKLRRKAKLLQQQRGKRRRMESTPSKVIRQKAGTEASGLWTPSLNGIFVNGLEVSARVIVLVPGDEVSLVGPTEGGKSLDIDCPAAIGFRVEAQPAEKKAQAATSSLSPQSKMQPTVGNNLQGSKMGCLSYDPGSNHCQQIDLHNMHCTEPESLPVKLMQWDHNEGGYVSAHGSSLIETTLCDKQGGGSRATHYVGSTFTNGVPQSNPCITVSSRLQVPQANESSFIADLDQRLLSIFNLVETSIRLRSDLLSCYPAGSSMAAELQKELQITTIYSNQGSSAYDDFFTECMHTVENTIKSCEDPLEKMAGERANEKNAGVSLGHTDQVGSFLPALSIPTDNCLLKNKNAYGMARLEDGGSPSLLPVSFSNRERFVEGAFDADQNLLIDCGNSSSHESVRPLYTASSSQEVRASDVLTQMFDIVACERRPATTCATPTAVKWDLLGGLINESLPTGDSIDGLRMLVHEEVKEDNAVEMKRCGKHPDANNVSLIVTEVAVENLTVIEAGGLFGRQACLNVNISNTHFPENEHTKGSDFQEEALKDDVCNLRGKIESAFAESGQVPIRFTQVIPENTCHQLPTMDVGLPDCLIERVCPSVSITPDKSLMTADDYLISYNKLVPCERDQGNVKYEKEEHTQKGNICMAQNSRLQDKVSIAQPQRLLQHTCTLHRLRIEDDTVSVNNSTGVVKSSDKEDNKQEEMDAVEQPEQQCVSAHLNVKKHVIDLPVGGPCYSDFKEADFGNEEVLLCTNHANVVSTPDMALIEGNENFLSMVRPDQGSKHVAQKQQNWCIVKVDDPFKVEADKQFQHHDTCSSQSLPITVQDGEAQQTWGYNLNQLEGVAAMRHSDKDNTVNLWDLLNLSDDVQALFIGTFTYDLEWFLSSAGLSRDIPVTVACHDTKYCWSKAPKDRCEKPYLEWPNVTLVYPPFPRSNAFGSKNQGIGCHHPKIFLIQRRGSLRVIVSSANLTHKQWFRVTNNVWWQDFSGRQTPDFICLFRGEKEPKSDAFSDFASQLAMFLAALLVDVPSEAHWVTDLAAFDFSNAHGSLVASIPGLHQPLYQNAPQFLMSFDNEAYHSAIEGDDSISGYLGVVPTTVVGTKYRFCSSVDPKGTRIRSFAATLNDATACEGSTMPVLLKRAKFLKADPNAVSVIATCRAKGCSQDLFLQQDLNDAEIDTMETDVFDTEEGFIKLGFLPREVAKWLAVLCDQGFFSFAACIWPREALAVASGQLNGAAKLALYVFQGPKFSTLSPAIMTSEERGAFSGLVKSLHNSWGLWRLEKVLCRYNWMDSCERSFYVSSSSIGTSLDAKFLAGFAAAAGRRADGSAPSQESDRQWGCWTADQEAANPSIGIVFPTIDRVCRDNFLHYGLLCFAESAWLRLKSVQMFHDAVPYPPEREGFPMHIKVAVRTFQDPLSSQSYGWMYCGSHNFSPAAWGRPIWRVRDWEPATDAGSALGSSLHICNYELGIVLMVPPPHENISRGDKEPGRCFLDRFTMPFKVPPPKYRDCDRPATGRAMMEAYMEMKALQLKAAEEDIALMQSEDPFDAACPPAQEEVESACNADREEARAEQVYVEALWTQIDIEDQRNK